MNHSLNQSSNQRVNEAVSDAMSGSLPSRAPADQGTGSMEQGNRDRGSCSNSPSTPPSPKLTRETATMDGPPAADEDEFDEFDDEFECTHCGGDGIDECDDTLAGCGPGCRSAIDGPEALCPCRACHGTGLRSHQWSF